MPIKDPLYAVWWTMRRRCERPSRREAARYQGRGIAVCERWKSFESFRADVSPRPAGTQLDRIDNNGPYSPENCRWVSPMENANNTRQNRPIHMFGMTRNLNQWGRELGINQTVIRKVLKRHALPEEAILNHFGITRRVPDEAGSGSPLIEDCPWAGTSPARLRKTPSGGDQLGVLRASFNQPTG